MSNAMSVSQWELTSIDLKLTVIQCCCCVFAVVKLVCLRVLMAPHSVLRTMTNNLNDALALSAVTTDLSGILDCPPAPKL